VSGDGRLRGNSVDAQVGTGRAERESVRASAVAVSAWSTINNMPVVVGYEVTMTAVRGGLVDDGVKT
jgi:hypothetical protein